MTFLGVLTPEEAERDWGISRNGDLVITSGLSRKSKTSPSSKSNPSASGSEKPEILAASEASNSASPDPMLPAMNGQDDWLQAESAKYRATAPQQTDQSQPKGSTTSPKSEAS